MIALVVAMAQNGVIGRAGGIPWHIRGEQAYFKRITWGHVVVMGRKTYASIGRPLPNRANYVMTRDPNFRVDGVVAVVTPDPIFELAKHQDVYVIGGTKVFQLFLDRADRFYQTLIEQDVAGDTLFPPWDPSQWQLESSWPGPSEEIPHRYNVYVRRSNPSYQGTSGSLPKAGPLALGLRWTSLLKSEHRVGQVWLL